MLSQLTLGNLFGFCLFVIALPHSNCVFSNEPIIASPGKIMCVLQTRLSGRKVFGGGIVYGETFDDRIALLESENVRSGLSLDAEQEKKIVDHLVFCNKLFTSYKADVDSSHEIDVARQGDFDRKRHDAVQRILDELTIKQKQKLDAYLLRHHFEPPSGIRMVLEQA